jgi:signal transduction histidine kinase
VTTPGGHRDVLRELVHDLRTPLAVVTGFGELLESKAASGRLDDATRDAYVARIRAAAAEMDEILKRTD